MIMRHIVWRELEIIRQKPNVLLGILLTIGLVVKVGMVTANTGINDSLLFSLTMSPALILLSTFAGSGIVIAESISQSLLALPVDVRKVFWGKVATPLIAGYIISCVSILIFSLYSYFVFGRVSGAWVYLFTFTIIPLGIAPVVALYTWIKWFTPKLIANIAWFGLISPLLALGLLASSGKIPVIKVILSSTHLSFLVSIAIPCIWVVIILLADKIDKEKLLEQTQLKS